MILQKKVMAGGQGKLQNAPATSILITSGSSFTIPLNWVFGQVTVECIGAAGLPVLRANAYDGGGGGAYAEKKISSYTPGQTFPLQIGQPSAVSGVSDTWFGSTTTVKAAGGLGLTGGLAGFCVGDIAMSGGNGGTAGAVGSGSGGGGGGGGGGAGGPDGVGATGGTGQAGGSGTGTGAGGGGGGANGGFGGQPAPTSNGGNARDGTSGGLPAAAGANSTSGAGSNGSGGGGGGNNGAAGQNNASIGGAGSTDARWGTGLGPGSGGGGGGRLRAGGDGGSFGGGGGGRGYNGVTDGVSKPGAIRISWKPFTEGGITAGGVPGHDYVMSHSFGTETGATSTFTFTHPAPGYTGTLDILMAGKAGLVGVYYDPDLQGGPQASGESAYFRYTCLGDETSFTMTQVGRGSLDSSLSVTLCTLMLVINGGVNNGKAFYVGSGQTNNGTYGAGGAPKSRAGLSFIPPLFYGACRAWNQTVFYSDSTSYDPALEASYGSSATTVPVDGHTMSMRFGLNPGGVTFDGVNYGASIVSGPGAVTSANSGRWVDGNYDLAVLVFRNDG